MYPMIKFYRVQLHKNTCSYTLVGSDKTIEGNNQTLIIIIIIIRNLYSAIMPLGGYRGAGGTGR